MNKNKKILIFNIVIFLLFIILSFGHGFSCCLTFGHGLGDGIYLFPIWIITLTYLILLIGFNKKLIKNYNAIIVFGLLAMIFIINLVFNRGPECPCYFFNN